MIYQNLPKLQSIEIGNTSFVCCSSLSLSSNSIQFYFSLYLPNLQTFKTDMLSLQNITSLSLSGNSIQFYFSIIYLPQLNQMSIGLDSLYKTSSISLQSTFASSLSMSRCSFQRWELFC